MSEFVLRVRLQDERYCDFCDMCDAEDAKAFFCLKEGKELWLNSDSRIVRPSWCPLQKVEETEYGLVFVREKGQC